MEIRGEVKEPRGADRGAGDKAGKARASQEAGEGVSDTPTILAIIESAMELTRQNPKPGEPVPSDNYMAYVIIQELRRNGWAIVRNSN